MGVTKNACRSLLMGVVFYLTAVEICWVYLNAVRRRVNERRRT